MPDVVTAEVTGGDVGDGVPAVLMSRLSGRPSPSPTPAGIEVLAQVHAVQEFSHLALDPDGTAAFRSFRDDLQALQDRLDPEPRAYWTVSPKILEVGVNG